MVLIVILSTIHYPPSTSVIYPRLTIRLLFLIVFFLPSPLWAQASLYKQLTKQVEELTSVGKFEEALTVGVQALEVSEKTYSPDHENVIQGLNTLAELNRHLGNYGEADTYYKRVFEIEKGRSKQNIEALAVSLNNLALNYMDWGRIDYAKPLLEEALKLYESEKNEDVLLARILGNLADLYRKEERFDEALLVYLRAVTLLEKKSNPILLAQTLNNLGLLYKTTGKYDEAIQVLTQAVNLYKKKLGKESADALLSQVNLASVYKSKNDFKQADALYRESLTGLEHTLGPDHPQIPRVLNNYSGLYFLQRHFGLAEGLVRRALAIAEKNFGVTNHPDVLTSLKNLELIYVEMGNTEELAKIQEKMNFVRYGPPVESEEGNR